MKIETSLGVKKVREAPPSIEAFNQLVDANLSKDQAPTFTIWYQDETKDWITISDDDDLLLAYDTAIEHFLGHLKVYVKPSFDKKKEGAFSSMMGSFFGMKDMDWSAYKKEDWKNKDWSAYKKDKGMFGSEYQKVDFMKKSMNK